MALGPPTVCEGNWQGVEALQSGLISVSPRSLCLLAFINWDDHFLPKLQYNLDRATSLLTTFQWFRKNKTMVFTGHTSSGPLLPLQPHFLCCMYTGLRAVTPTS